MAQPIDDVALDTIFRTARTFNAYTDHPFTEADARAIHALVKMGPTSANQQPARFVWCLSTDAKARLAALSMDSNADKIRAAPAAVIVGMDSDFHEHLPDLFPLTDARSWFTGDADLRAVSAMRNSTLQGAYLIIAARALGWDTGPMSGFDNAGVDKAFFADTPNVTSNFIMTIGKGDPRDLFDRSPRPAFDRFNTVV